MLSVGLGLHLAHNTVDPPLLKAEVIWFPAGLETFCPSLVTKHKLQTRLSEITAVVYLQAFREGDCTHLI